MVFELQNHETDLTNKFLFSNGGSRVYLGSSEGRDSFAVVVSSDISTA